MDSALTVEVVGVCHDYFSFFGINNVASHELTVCGYRSVYYQVQQQAFVYVCVFVYVCCSSMLLLSLPNFWCFKSLRISEQGI